MLRAAILFSAVLVVWVTLSLAVHAWELKIFGVDSYLDQHYKVEPNKVEPTDVDALREAEYLQRKARTKVDLEQALLKYKQALTTFQKVRKSPYQWVTLHRIGSLYDRLGQLKKAMEYYEEALSITTEAIDSVSKIRVPVIGSLRPDSTDLVSEGVTLTLDRIATAHSSLGQHEKALEYYEKSLRVAGKMGDAEKQTDTLNKMGMIYAECGQYQKALEHYEKSLAIMRNANVSNESLVLSNVAGVYSLLGQYDKALEYYVKSLRDAEMKGTYERLANIRKNLGDLYTQIGRYDEALVNLENALRSLTSISAPTDRVKASMGGLYLYMHDLVKAEKFLTEAGDSASLGRLHLFKSDYQKAEEYYTKLLTAAEKSQKAEDIFVACMGLGKVYEGLTNYKMSEGYYDRGMKITEELRSALLPAERKNFFEAKIQGFARSEAAHGLTRVRMKLNQAAGSIDSSEVTRARSLSDKIALTGEGGVSGLPKAILEKEDQLLSRVTALKKELARTDKEKQVGRYENLSKEIKAAETDLKAFVEMLWEKHKAYAAVKYPRPVTLKESALRPDECVVMFDVSSEGVGVKLVKGRKILQTFYSDWPANELESDVRKFREPFATIELKAFDAKLGESLYKKLLARVLMDIPKGTPITIIPDGVLAVLPFEALIVSEKSNASDRVTYVSDQYPISYYQSITALTLARTMGEKRKKGDRLLVIADPVFQLKDERAQATKRTEVAGKDKDYIGNIMYAIEQAGFFKLRRLPETAVLAANLKSLYGPNTETCTDFRADKADFLKNIAPRLDQYSAVVFATHGVFSTKVPGLMEPFLALTMMPPGTDGFLKMSDVMGLKMNADIVALTACQTGLGKELSGEGIMSMGRAFQYAGARTVLMSLWSVAEKSSVQLVESFFRNLKQGKSKLESLKLAREEIRKAGYEHPFFWAPFILVGETD